MVSKKLSEKELQSLNSFQTTNNEIVVEIGAAELRINALQKQKEDLLKRFQTLQVDQKEFGLEMQKKYGDGNIDLEKGEFTAAK
jgi:hypothetical protein|tara:strand:- start:1496 stop:1747 length:252 start_codon:yes stop_codon:yes gene_type:complete